LLGWLLLSLVCIVASVRFLFKSFKSTARSWRDIATRLGLVLALSSGLVVATYFLRVAIWTDKSAAPGALIGIETFVKWGYWGLRVALAAFFMAWFGRSWERIISLLNSLLFGSFWLIGYTVF
jgi:hypothetical protein